MGREEYEAEFITRTRKLREAASITQRQMGELLGCGLEAYRKYETRSPMPAFLMAKFAIIVNTELDFLLNGYKKMRRPLPARTPVAKLRRAGTEASSN